MLKMDPTHRPNGFADSAVILALCTATIIAPIALGATGERARVVLELLMAGIAVTWAATGNRSWWAMAMPLVAAGLVGIQLTPLPDPILAFVAPLSAAAWKVAHAETGAQWGCISIDPGATAAACRRLFVALSTVVVVADLCRSLRERHRLMTSLGIAAIVILSLGVLFPVDFKDRILLGVVDLKGPISFWKTPLKAPIQTAGFGHVDVVRAGDTQYALDEGSVGDGFGSYICSNHFAGALCLTIPIAIATLLSLLPGRLPSAIRVLASAAFGGGSLAVAGGLAGSRAGALALGFALTVLTWLCTRPPWPRKIAAATVAMYALGIIAILLALYGPFHPIADYAPAALKPKINAVLSDARVQAATVAGRMFFASPLLGTGLSTFSLMYPRAVAGSHVLFYAHNDYAQLLSETGLLGGLICALFLWRMGRLFAGFIRRPRAAASDWDAGPWAALAGLAAHSAFDWNLHVPANAFLASLVAGLAISSPQAGPRNRPAPLLSMSTRLLVAIFILACASAGVLLTRDAVSESVQNRLRRAITADRIVAMNPDRPSAFANLSGAVAAGRRMAYWDSWNARLAVLLAQASLHLAKEARPGDDAQRYAADANEWFRKAKTNCAACRGIPLTAP